MSARRLLGIVEELVIEQHGPDALDDLYAALEQTPRVDRLEVIALDGEIA